MRWWQVTGCCHARLVPPTLQTRVRSKGRTRVSGERHTRLDVATHARGGDDKRLWHSRGNALQRRAVGIKHPHRQPAWIDGEAGWQQNGCRSKVPLIGRPAAPPRLNPNSLEPSRPSLLPSIRSSGRGAGASPSGQRTAPPRCCCAEPPPHSSRLEPCLAGREADRRRVGASLYSHPWRSRRKSPRTTPLSPWHSSAAGRPASGQPRGRPPPMCRKHAG